MSFQKSSICGVMSPSLLISILLLCACNGGASDDDFDSTAKDYLEDSHGKLVHASIIFRHGDRSIVKPYPTDPNPISVWPDGLGQLSKEGKKEEYELGTWFRQRYKDSLLSENYRYDRVLIESSDYDRTLMSAECIMAAIFPPHPDELWNGKNLTWQPIPVHTRPKEMDNVIALDAPCDRVDLEKAKMNRSPDLRTFYYVHEEIFEYASLHSGLKMERNDPLTAIIHLSDLYDTLFIEKKYNLTLPAWTRALYPEPLKSASALRFMLDAYTVELQRLKAGPLLNSVVSDMKRKISGHSNQTLHFYSGHDTTISCLLATLNAFDMKQPPYCSSVLIELRQKDKDYIVTLSYKNSTTEAPYLVDILGCHGVCKLQDFENVASLIIPKNWHAECNVSIHEYLLVHHEILFLLSMVLISMSGSFLMYLRLRRARKRRYRQYQRVMKGVLEPPGN